MRDFSLSNRSSEYRLLKIKNWIIYNTFSIPKTLVIELSTYCNKSCDYCFRKGVRKFEQRFSERKILDRLLRYKYDKIVLIGYGEPLLHPDFDDVILALSRQTSRLLINTNGTLILDHISTLSKLLGKIEIYLSIHDIHEALHLIQDLVQRLGKAVLTCIRCVVTVSQNNLQENIVAVDELTKLGVSKIYISCIIPVDRDSCDKSCIDSEMCEKNIRNIALRSVSSSFIRNSFVYIPRFRSGTGFFICPFVENDCVFIRADGSACPCMFYAYELRTYIHCIERTNIPLIFGNLHEQELDQIWNSPEYSRFRFLVATRQFPNCLECELEQFCSFTVNNLQDCWGNTPTCSYCPFARGLTYCPT